MTENFAEAERGLRATNASAGDRDLVALLKRHAADEDAIVARYQRFATEANSPAVRYLIQLIIDDETRHHRVTEELANAIGWDGIRPEHPVGTVPDLGFGAESEELRNETQRLLEIEERDSHDLQALRKTLRDYADTTIWRVLVDMMIHDTEKHKLVLEFIKHHSKK